MQSEKETSKSKRFGYFPVVPPTVGLCYADGRTDEGWLGGRATLWARGSEDLETQTSLN